MIAKGIKLDKMITLHTFLETQKHAVHDPAVAEEHLRRPEREEHLLEALRRRVEQLRQHQLNWAAAECRRVLQHLQYVPVVAATSKTR
jgi:hypothetical protein